MQSEAITVPVEPRPSDEAGVEPPTRSSPDPAELVARIAMARRAFLLRVHRRRLRWEDLEDCYSQATLELVARARRQAFRGPEHALNALEQKFESRIEDRRRALGGRSPIERAIATALPVGELQTATQELEDRRVEVVRQVAGRIALRQLREVVAELSADQRLVIAAQFAAGLDCHAFCARFGWTQEKYRKVAQRARLRLRALVDEYELGERCRRLEPDLLAWAAGAADPVQAARARAHLANCTSCARNAAALDHAARRAAALLPVPIQAHGWLVGKLIAGWRLARRVLPLTGHGGAEAGAAGGYAIGAGAVKLSVATVCIAGVAGGYALCTGPRMVNRAHHVAAREHARPHADVAHVAAPAQARAVRVRIAAVPPGAPLTRTAAAAQAEREFAGALRVRAAALAPGRVPRLRGSAIASVEGKDEFGFER